MGNLCFDISTKKLNVIYFKLFHYLQKRTNLYVNVNYTFKMLLIQL